MDQLDSDSDYNSTTSTEDDGSNAEFKFDTNPIENGKEIEYSPPKRKLVRLSVYLSMVKNIL